jgi:hypothetical protein
MHQVTFLSFASSLKAKQSFLSTGRILNFIAPSLVGKQIMTLAAELCVTEEQDALLNCDYDYDHTLYNNTD